MFRKPRELRHGASPAGAGLARSGTSLAGVTFTPAQPPFTVNSLLGETTNLKQKKPFLVAWWGGTVTHPAPSRNKHSV